MLVSQRLEDARDAVRDAYQNWFYESHNHFDKSLNVKIIDDIHFGLKIFEIWSRDIRVTTLKVTNETLYSKNIYSLDLIEDRLYSQLLEEDLYVLSSK